MSLKLRRKYYQDFKRNAVLLCAEPGRSVTQVAESLGINKDLLYRWRREYHRAKGQYVFPGNGVEALTPDQKRIRELEKKLRDTEMERSILKKPWASSAGHRNEVSIHERSPLRIYDEEDVPGIKNIHERFLPLGE